MYYFSKKKRVNMVYSSTKSKFDICTISPPWKLQVDKIIIYIVCRLHYIKLTETLTISKAFCLELN